MKIRLIMFLFLLAQAVAPTWGLAQEEPVGPPPERETDPEPAGPAGDSTEVESGLKELVASVEAYYAEKGDFSAEFEQVVKRSHLPDRPITKRGRVYFKKPGMMRWDYEEPDKVYYVSDGEFLWNYIPESKLCYKLKVKDSELFYALKFLWGDGSLDKDFDVSDGGKEGEHRVIVVKPRESEQNFQVLKLLVAPDSSRIAETLLVDPAGNESRLQFLKISHQKLPEKGFKFKPPADVQVEDLSADRQK